MTTSLGKLFHTGIILFYYVHVVANKLCYGLFIVIWVLLSYLLHALWLSGRRRPVSAPSRPQTVRPCHPPLLCRICVRFRLQRKFSTSCDCSFFGHARPEYALMMLTPVSYIPSRSSLRLSHRGRERSQSDRVWQERFLVTWNPLPNSRVQRLLSEDKKLGYRRGCAMLLRFFLTLNNVVTLKSGL